MTTTQQDPRKHNVWFDPSSLKNYFSDYKKALNLALSEVNENELEKAFDVMKKVAAKEGTFFVCGNGGSAAIADHLCCDWTKGTFVDGHHRLRTYSLNSNSALMTAMANDFGADEIFAYQLKILARSQDALIVISSSGNSPNVIKAIETAKKINLPTIAFTGFTGGKAKDMVDASLYVPYSNYAIVEDAHQALMQCLAQYYFASLKK